MQGGRLALEALLPGLLRGASGLPPPGLPGLIRCTREYGAAHAQASSSLGGFLSVSNIRLESLKTHFEGLCLLLLLVTENSTETFSQNCLPWLRSLQHLIQSQDPLPTMELAVLILGDLLEFSCQLPYLAREIGTNHIPGLLTSLLALKHQGKLATFFLSCVDAKVPRLQQVDFMHKSGTGLEAKVTDLEVTCSQMEGRTLRLSMGS
ncbi:proline-, glutamic acid- and leucine-rich protein 1-like [Anolis carolinensis]|uniref:proline-, glutamic acid- and leucine-rich protein 1-like n=1 Tax=Anolis carolinensis TaxID=28377 RepID=UPI002F2B2884